jgi:hypothetical protein
MPYLSVVVVTGCSATVLTQRALAAGISELLTARRSFHDRAF